MNEVCIWFVGKMDIFEEVRCCDVVEGFGVKYNGVEIFFVIFVDMVEDL